MLDKHGSSVVKFVMLKLADTLNMLKKPGSKKDWHRTGIIPQCVKPEPL